MEQYGIACLFQRHLMDDNKLVVANNKLVVQQGRTIDAYDAEVGILVLFDELLELIRQRTL
jgi:hypothetical protein